MKIDIEKLLLTDLTKVTLVNSKGQEYVPIMHGHWERVAEQPYFRKRQKKVKQKLHITLIPPVF
jgi:hypothetical protein